MQGTRQERQGKQSGDKPVTGVEETPVIKAGELETLEEPAANPDGCRRPQGPRDARTPTPAACSPSSVL